MVYDDVSGLQPTVDFAVVTWNWDADVDVWWNVALGSHLLRCKHVDDVELWGELIWYCQLCAFRQLSLDSSALMFVATTIRWTQRPLTHAVFGRYSNVAISIWRERWKLERVQQLTGPQGPINHGAIYAVVRGPLRPSAKFFLSHNVL